jgi:Amt family ammonium transporter
MPRRLHLLLISAALAVAAAGPAFAEPPKLEEVAKAAADTTVAINFMWTLIGGFLVMFMQAGFAMVETGFTRAKNASHTMAMNLMVYGIAMAGYWLCG